MGRGSPYWIAERAGRRFYYGWAIAAVVLLANLSVFSFNPSFGLFVTPLEREFGWSRSDIAGSLTVGTIVGALLAPLLGFLVDRFGTRRLMVGFGLASAACYVGLAHVQQVWQFTLGVALIYPLSRVGVGEMMGSVNVNRWFVRRRGRAMGIVMMGASAGSVIFIPLCTYLIATQGWRTTYTVLGGAAAVLICLPAWLLLVDRPEAIGLAGHPELKGAGLSSASLAAGGAGAATGGGRDESWSLREVTRTRTFWLTLLGFMLGTVAVQGYFIHAVPHMEARGFSRALASAVWSTFFLVGVPAKFLWGFVIERIGVRRALVLLFVGEGLGIALLLTARSPAALFAYAALNAVGHAPFLQLQAMVWAEYFGRHAIGRIYGTVQPAIVVSASLGPWLGGMLFDLTGNYTLFFEIGMALCALSSLVFLLTPPPRRASAPAGRTVAA